MQLRTLLATSCLLLASAPLQASIWPAAADGVERDLASEEVSVRKRAAERLVTLPRAALARAALRALGDADVEVRLSAAQAALAAAVPGLSERLLPWLTESEARLRLVAAEALSRSPVPRAVAPLVRTLSDADPSVRRVSASALGESGSAEAVVGLLGRLDDPSPEVREAVVRALAALGDARAVVPLISKIEDAVPSIRREVARALGTLADLRAASALVLALRDVEPEVRAAALEALGELSATGSVSSIISVLSEDGAPSVRRAAVAALARIGDRDGIQALIRAFAGSPELREALVDALTRVGQPAVPALQACLQSSAARETLEGCALALAGTRVAGAGAAIRAALARAALGSEAALAALADLDDPEALPVALGYLTDAEPSVRQAARRAAKALLTPASADGRAVEPLEAAFARGGQNRGEALQLIELLGRTGSARAQRLLVPLAQHADDLDFRLTALTALGELQGEAATSDSTQTLLAALSDEQASVRLAAALSLRRAAPPGVAKRLLDRLERAATQDRRALGIALGGVLSRTQEPAVLTRLTQALAGSRGAERDVWIEALGQLPLQQAGPALQGLQSSPDPADRAKLAEILASQPRARALLLPLLRDRQAAVRANAAWSLGWVATAEDVPPLLSAMSDSERAVAANAVTALGLVGARLSIGVEARLCGLLPQAPAVLQQSALSALRVLGKRCPGGGEAELLRRSLSTGVRRAAARLLRDVPAGPTDQRWLRRCARDDPQGQVAVACDGPVAPPSRGAQSALIFVVPSAEALPVPGAAFGLVRPDGVTRYGFADRRGAVFETGLPAGELHLALPAASED